MKTTYLLCIGIFICTICSAQFQGPFSPSSFTTLPILGASATWANPEESGRSDDSYTDFGNLPNGGRYTDYLVVTDFNFNIPAGVTILGILVEVERSDPNKLTSDFRARIVKGGIIGNTDRSAGAYPETDAYQSYGSATDLWGQTWNYKDITNNDFGFAIAAQRNADGGITAGQIDDIRITVYYSSTLPVDLISFSAIKGKSDVQLSWTTAAESGMDHYDVERSVTGSNFTAITHTASLNRNTNTTYKSTDVAPVKGLSYYRLKLVDNNGSFKYSPVVSVHFDGAGNVFLFPNPLLHNQTLYVNNPDKEKLSVQFFDLSGKIVNTAETTSNEVPLNLSRGGLLFYRVNNVNGETVSTGKLIAE